MRGSVLGIYGDRHSTLLQRVGGGANDVDFANADSWKDIVAWSGQDITAISS